MKQSILKGAACGLLAWSVYGIIEVALSAVLVRIARPEIQVLEWQWPLIGLLGAVYALFGLVLGSVGGALLSASGRGGVKDGPRIVAALTLVLAFIVNLIPAWPLARSEDIALAVAVLLAAGLTAALASDIWHRWMGFLANPWAVALLLLGSPWISREGLGDRSAMFKTAVSFVVLAAVVGCTALFYNLQSNRVAPIGRQAGTTLAVLGILTIVILGVDRGSVPTAYQSPAFAGIARPNILLITMDTVRADHLSLYGYNRDTTPNLKKLAREATLYNRAIATADFTLPTHASIFTGLYPSWHGATFAPPEYPLGRGLAPNAITLAEVLRSHGYATAAVVANYSYLHPSLGLNQGFSEYDSHRPAFLARANFARPFYLREGARTLLSLIMDVSAFDSMSLRAEDVNQRALALLGKGLSRAPFFLFLNYMDAHRPYAAPAPFHAEFTGEYPPFEMRDYDDLKKLVINETRPLSSREGHQLTSLYDGGIAYIDAKIGSLLERLRELGLYENTLIIITADHGEAFGEHNLMEHALGSVYQDQLHIPLLIKYPAQHDSRESDDLVSQVDLMPTALDLVGIAVPAAVQGRSLRTPGAEGRGFVSSEASMAPIMGSTLPKSKGLRRAIFSGSLKLITWTEGPSELYDLAIDPAEKNNLYDPHNAAAKVLAARMAEWTASIPRLSAAAPAKLDRSGVERLKSLGYVQ